MMILSADNVKIISSLRMSQVNTTMENMEGKREKVSDERRTNVVRRGPCFIQTQERDVLLTPSSPITIYLGGARLPASRFVAY